MRVYAVLLSMVWLAGVPQKPAVVSPAPSAAPPPQAPAGAPAAKTPGPADVAQLALDQHLYFALKLTLDVAEGQLRPEQRDYFSGMLAFHQGRFEDARKSLIAALNARDTQLTSTQKIEAFETLGRDARITGEFGACAQMFEDIDKIWGARLGDAEQGIKQNRHLCVAQIGRPHQTIEFAKPFTIRRTGSEYPVRIGSIEGAAQLDTGADETVLSESTAKLWGVAPSEASVVLHGYSGGTFTGHPGLVASLTIGTATLHSVPVMVVPDEDLYIAPVKLQIHALLGLPVLQALGRLTFARDGSLSADPSPVAPASDAGEPLWLGDSQILVQAGTMPGTRGFHYGGAHEPRLFVLDTGSGSSYLTNHYFYEHPGQFEGPPLETAKLAGAGGEVDIPSYGARRVPLWFGSLAIELNGPHVLTAPMGNEMQHYEGLLGQDVLGTLASYSLDFRAMRFSLEH